jgi:hypothetical protein
MKRTSTESSAQHSNDPEFQSDSESHGRVCIGEHVTLCLERDGHMLAFPNCEYPDRLAKGILMLVRGLAQEPESILCLLGSCDGHRAEQGATW